jgi:NADH dehydrogenase (ubiquinone) Fe-S protein 3
MSLYYKECKIRVYKSFLAFLKKIAPILIKKLLFNRNCDALIKVNRSGLLVVLSILKNHILFQYKSLVDLVVYDRPTTKLRFSVIYLLLSELCNSRVSVCTYASEVLGLSSSVRLYKGANWFEREA